MGSTSRRYIEEGMQRLRALGQPVERAGRAFGSSGEMGRQLVDEPWEPEGPRRVPGPAARYAPIPEPRIPPGYHRDEWGRIRAKPDTNLPRYPGADIMDDVRKSGLQGRAALDEIARRTNSADAATHQKTTQHIQTGPRGGQYYIAASGEKVYRSGR